MPAGSDDEDAGVYLSDLLDAVETENGGVESSLVPITVEGDGFCLTHAVSRALFGSEARASTHGGSRMP